MPRSSRGLTGIRSMTHLPDVRKVLREGVCWRRSSLDSGSRWCRITGRSCFSGENGGIVRPALLKDERERGARAGASALIAGRHDEI